MSREDDKKKISAEEFDRRFDNGEDISAYVDWSKAEWPGLDAKRVNVDFPTWMVGQLDQEARRLGITRQSLIKYWIGERLDEVRKARAKAGPPILVAREEPPGEPHE